MSVKRIIYLILSTIGLVMPWYYNLQFFQTAGFLDFVNASSANLAAKSVSIDLFIATVAGSILIYAESKRLGMKLAWMYILLGLFVAFSCAVPLFLFMRETKLEKLSDVDD